MKYLLIEHSDDDSGSIVTICDTPKERETKTREAITTDGSELCRADLDTLRDEGMLYFEGDPLLQWINAAKIIK